MAVPWFPLHSVCTGRGCPWARPGFFFCQQLLLYDSSGVLHVALMELRLGLDGVLASAVGWGCRSYGATGLSGAGMGRASWAVPFLHWAEVAVHAGELLLRGFSSAGKHRATKIEPRGAARPRSPPAGHL